MENWLSVPGYEGLYDVSDQGSIRSHWMGGKVMSASSNGRGYMQVNLTAEDRSKARKYVHRIVLSAFVGDHADLDANHKDGDKANNRLENLEWTTRAENHQHRYDVLQHVSPMKGRSGSNHPVSKKFLITHPDGNQEVIHGLTQFCREHGLSQPLMSTVAAGNRDHHKNFRCEHVNVERAI